MTEHLSERQSDKRWNGRQGRDPSTQQRWSGPTTEVKGRRSTDTESGRREEKVLLKEEARLRLKNWFAVIRNVVFVYIQK